MKDAQEKKKVFFTKKNVKSRKKSVHQLLHEYGKMLTIIKKSQQFNETECKTQLLFQLSFIPKGELWIPPSIYEKKDNGIGWKDSQAVLFLTCNFIHIV